MFRYPFLVDPRTNPYSPGAGLRPAALAGRESGIEAFEILADRAVNGLTSRSMGLPPLRLSGGVESVQAALAVVASSSNSIGVSRPRRRCRRRRW